MKRFMIFALIAALLIASSCASAEDEAVLPLPELMEALREAGRETENILAYDVYMNGDTPETAVFLVQSGETAQLTVLEAGEDGAWHITGRNDTIPASIITDARLDLMDGPVSEHTHSGREWIKLETLKYIPLYSIGEANVMLGYFSLDFQRTSEGNWTLCLVCDIPFEEAEEGRCPYHLLHFRDGGWEYRFYEEIMDDAGWWDRSDMILRKTVPAEEMSPYTEMSKLDVPAFLAFLRKLVPQEYEHAQRHSDTATVPPTAAPASVPDNPAGKGQDTVYYNPMGGRYYHADSECSSVAPAYRPLTPIPADELSSEKFRILQPCPHCAMPDSPSPSPAPTDAPSGTNAGKSILKAAAPGYGDRGLTSLWILMDTPERQAYILESFPPYCYMDPDHDGDVIRIFWYPEMNDRQETPQEPYGERWSLTFEFTDNTWQLTDVTNGRDWTARAEHYTYTFDDYHDPGGAWQWSADFETRLTEFDYTGLKNLVDMYNAAMPDRPSLCPDALD